MLHASKGVSAFTCPSHDVIHLLRRLGMDGNLAFGVPALAGADRLKAELQTCDVSSMRSSCQYGSNQSRVPSCRFLHASLLHPHEIHWQCDREAATAPEADRFSRGHGAACPSGSPAISFPSARCAGAAGGTGRRRSSLTFSWKGFASSTRRKTRIGKSSFVGLCSVLLDHLGSRRNALRTIALVKSTLDGAPGQRGGAG